MYITVRVVLKGEGKWGICPRAPQLGKIKGRLELEKLLLVNPQIILVLLGAKKLNTALRRSLNHHHKKRPCILSKGNEIIRNYQWLQSN